MRHNGNCCLLGSVSDETPLTESTNTSMITMLRSILVLLCIASVVSAVGYYPPVIRFADPSSEKDGSVYTPETDSESALFF